MWILNAYRHYVMCHVCSNKRCLKCYDVLSIHPYLIVIRDVAFDQMCCVIVAVPYSMLINMYAYYVKGTFRRKCEQGMINIKKLM